MIQRAMAFKLETEGSSLAETFGALTSGDVEDSISGMGASPLPALTELRVALRMPKPASRNEDALGTG